ncbi:beta,beta-carotene 9, 10 -oxygenase-like protein [Labeo rohita]|uniref:Beta,beta-carotene 9, 10-oxygenase-like protein n=1 Tax=Labeo rohita TaxID=84645 RepID=A0A498NJL1_LABRO|nr:beta,beta-carotene 9, 10 -oxygenase-like protein [Labeo rohita]
MLFRSGRILTAKFMSKPTQDAVYKVPANKKRPSASGLEFIGPLVSSVDETPDPISTVIKGEIPSWITGSFFRNGPGKFEFGESKFNHWFDGMALMHRFHIEDGQVTYSSRFLQSDSYVQNAEKNRIVVSEFGTLATPDPCKNIFSRFFSRFQIPKATDNAGVSFVKYKGDFYVSTETNFMRRIDPVSLETKEKIFDLMFAVMSENYIVFIEQPIKLDLLKFMLYRVAGKSFHKIMTWNPELETIFHVADRRTGQLIKTKYYSSAMFTLHQINAYEDSGYLIMDMCCGDDGNVIGDFTMENLRASGEELDKFFSSLCTNLPRRYVLPLDVKEDEPNDHNLISLPYTTATAVKTANGVFLSHEDLYNDDLLQYGGLEFPQINYTYYNARPYRYFYACGFGHVFGDSLLKMDLEGKKLKVWRHAGLFPSEPVFVPAPDAKDEDDGVVMSVVITPKEKKSSFLLVLDAKTFTELGRAEVPVDIPYGTHGLFNEKS